MTWTGRRYAWLLAGAAVGHTLLAAALQVSGDEAYYWDCSRHLDWATFDQPSFVIWAMIPFRTLLGETALAVRAPSIVASLLIGVILLLLVRRLGGRTREAAVAYLLLHATPLFFLGSFYASTDIAMVAAMLGATWAIVAIVQGERRAWWGLGVAVGIGFLAKFPAVLVLAGLVPVVASREARRDMHTPTPYLAAALSIALTAPVWIWAVQHNWDNLAFQLRDRHVGGTLGLTHVLELAVSNLILATPFLGVAMVVAWWRWIRGHEPARQVVAAVMLAPILVFGLVSLREPVAAHWGAPAIVLGCVLLALEGVGRKVVVTGAAFGLTLSLAVVGGVALVDRLATWTAAPTLGLYRKEATVFASLVGHDEITREIERRLRPGELMASESYTSVHLHAFLSGGRLPTRLAKLTGGKHGFASLYWYPSAELAEKDFLYVTEKPRLAARIEPLFERVEEAGPELLVTRGGTVVRRVHFFRCSNLRRPEGVFTRLGWSPGGRERLAGAVD